MVHQVGKVSAVRHGGHARSNPGIWYPMAKSGSRHGNIKMPAALSEAFAKARAIGTDPTDNVETWQCL